MGKKNVSFVRFKLPDDAFAILEKTASEYRNPSRFIAQDVLQFVSCHPEANRLYADFIRGKFCLLVED